MHPNSLQDYIIENTNISGKMVKAQVQSGATAQEAMQPSRAETVCFVRTRILRSKLSTFIGKEPWPTIQESLLKIMWKLLCAGRAIKSVIKSALVSCHKIRSGCAQPARPSARRPDLSRHPALFRHPELASCTALVCPGTHSQRKEGPVT